MTDKQKKIALVVVGVAVAAVVAYFVFFSAPADAATTAAAPGATGAAPVPQPIGGTAASLGPQVSQSVANVSTGITPTVSTDGDGLAGSIFAREGKPVTGNPSSQIVINGLGPVDVLTYGDAGVKAPTIVGTGKPAIGATYAFIYNGLMYPKGTESFTNIQNAYSLGGAIRIN